MNKLQLIMVLGVVLAAGLTWQVASQSKLEAAQQSFATSAVSSVTHADQSTAY